MAQEDSNFWSSVSMLHSILTPAIITVPLVQIRLAAQTQGHRTLMLTTAPVLLLARGLDPVQKSSTLVSAFEMISEVQHGALLSASIR